MNGMDPRGDPDDARQSSPAAERNKGAIAALLARHLPASGLVLEVASGTGQHIVHFAAEFPALVWQPSDPDEGSRRSIASWRRSAGLSNLRDPIRLDVQEQPWPLGECVALVCINMIHIAPWSASLALFEGAAQALARDGLMFLYGPYRVGGRHTADSNAAFDESLRLRDPAWGVRDLDEVLAIAAGHDFGCIEVVPMPANNLSVVLKLSAAERPRRSVRQPTPGTARADSREFPG
jgi:SAM-dependent methyltransferase